VPGPYPARDYPGARPSAGPGNQFRMRWTGPFDQAAAARQSSALDGLIAAVALSG
jgi:hypothetical protein